MSVDYLIVTPMPEEFVAVVEYFPSAILLDKTLDDPHTYKSCRLRTARNDGAEYEIVLTTLTSKGQLSAAAELPQMLSRWTPRHVLLVGIAGGNQNAGITTGDILLAMDIIGEIAGKVTDQGTARDSAPVLVSRTLYESACQLLGSQWHTTIQASPPVPTIPRCHHDGIVASVSEVLADSNSMTTLHSKYRHLLGIETEAAGVWSALRVVERPPAFFMVRSVSDSGDVTKTDEWHRFAASAAGAFCHALLRRGPTPAIGSATLPMGEPPFETIRMSKSSVKGCCAFPEVKARSLAPPPFAQRAALDVERLRTVCRSKCRIHKMLILPILAFLAIFVRGMRELRAAGVLTPINVATVGGCLLIAFYLWWLRENYRAVIEQATDTGLAFCNVLCTTTAGADDVSFYSQLISYYDSHPRLL